MENPGWMRLIVVGLVLAALAIGYFLLSGSFVKTKPKSEVSNKVVVVETPTPKVSGVTATASAYTRIVNRTQGIQGGVQTLPATGFPLTLIGIFSAGAAVAGFGLRKFPN
ncbi:MAG: Uncharacterized protein G01um10147_916 [Microgenomates group bacterium Gr01-1014_7]|nr:MAG: Uncharacterized protein G01um10147_916 [Microgenomates group bacterium Gr01-1014_7]